LPTPTSKTTVSSTVTISGTKDYNMQQFCADPNTLGPGDQSESQKPVFLLAANAVLKNVIIGGSGCSAADGVHCESGSCTLENVWFGDVGEDAITFKGSNSSQIMTISGGGAFSATDKTIQHNGPGTIKISNFYLNTAGKLYRSCGNCSTQYARHVVVDNVTAKSVSRLVGINVNYNDTATLTNITICGGGTTICEKYNGNNTGAEPTSAGSGPDGKNCIYSSSDITTR
jgi:pectate lyase